VTFLFVMRGLDPRISFQVSYVSSGEA